MTSETISETMRQTMELAKSRPADSECRVVFCMTTESDAAHVAAHADGELPLAALAQFVIEVGRRVTSVIMSGEKRLSHEEATELVKTFFEVGCDMAEKTNAPAGAISDYPIQ